MGQRLQSRSISGDNLFTDAAQIQGYFNISISGTWTGTVTAQRSFDLGSTWYDVSVWTGNTEEYGFEPENKVYYRVGIKSGEFVSGTCVVRLSQ